MRTTPTKFIVLMGMPFISFESQYNLFCRESYYFLLEKWLLNRKMKIYIDISFDQFKHLSKFMVQYLVYAKLHSFFSRIIPFCCPTPILLKRLCQLCTSETEVVCLPSSQTWSLPCEGHRFQCTGASCLAGPCPEE